MDIALSGTSFRVDPVGHEWFWPAVSEGRWEPEMFRLLDRLLRPDWRMVDVGAWIGPLTLHGVQKCRHVDAYECDPVALASLHRNIALNPEVAGRIAVHEHAIGATDGLLTLHSRSLGNSETSILARHQRDGAVLDCPISITCGVRDALAVFSERGYLADPRTFVKVDVEGAEFLIVDRLRSAIAQSRCVWCISVHEMNINPPILPPNAVRAAEVIRLFDAFSDLNWYGMDLVTLDKSALVNSVLGGSWPYHQTFVFTGSPIGIQ